MAAGWSRPRSESAAMEFAIAVRGGLTALQKSLPSKYLYDDVGSALFEAICNLPEYYLTRAETEVLSSRAQEIVDAVGTPVELIELGSGSAVKTRFLIDAAFARQDRLRYRPVDISSSALELSTKALTREYPGIIIDGINADYLNGLARISRNGARKTMALFLGSNVGNFEPDEAQRTLAALRSVLEPGDGLLLGADLKKDRAVLERAYDDPLGVTAAFDLNLLARINRELGGKFDLASFRHEAAYQDSLGRVEMRLISRVRQDVRIDGIGMAIHFEEGESIHTESSYKYDDRTIEILARASAFSIGGKWTDAAGRFADYLLIAD
jgi:L-histidine N-alpha-methyltransferase